MSFIDRLLGGFERRSPMLLSDPSDEFKVMLGLTSSYSGKSVTVDSALSLVPFFAGVRLLAETTALCPLVVYEGDGVSKTRAVGSPQWKLLHDRPNDEHPPDYFFENITGHLNCWGNYYAEKLKGGRDNQVGELWPLIPSKVKVSRDKKQRKVFEVEGNSRSFGADTILHIWAFGYDGLRGLSPVSVARQMLGSALGREEFDGRFWSNNAHHAGVIEMPGRFASAERRDSFARQWDRTHRGLENAWKTPVLEEGAAWKSIGMPLKDAEFMESMRFTVNQSARLLRIPPEMIGGDRENSLTYSNIEAQVLSFLKFSMFRWFMRIEKSLKHDRDLFPAEANRSPKFNLEGLLRADSITRAQFYESMSRVQAMTVNEIRELEDRAPVEWGDERPAAAAAPVAPESEPEPDSA